MMHKLYLLLLSLMMHHCMIHGEAALSPTISQEVQKYSHYEGYSLAKSLHASEPWIDLHSVIQGMQEYIDNGKIDAHSPDIDQKTIVFHLFVEEANRNLQKAENFLHTLTALPHMHVLKEGNIVYEVLHDGSGDDFVCKASAPTVHYTISSLDDQIVVDTRTRGTPVKVSLNEAIEGFSEGIVGMKVGERRKIFIHPAYAYGKAGLLPPNSLLIVDVEVIFV